MITCKDCANYFKVGKTHWCALIREEINPNYEMTEHICEFYHSKEANLT